MEKEEQITLNSLIEIQRKLEQVNNMEAAKIAEVHAKFESTRQQIYRFRNETISQLQSFWVTAVCITLTTTTIIITYQLSLRISNDKFI